MPKYNVTIKIVISSYTDLTIEAETEDAAASEAEATVSMAIDLIGAQSLKTYDEFIDDHYCIHVQEQ